jgi:hypothetical protein
MPARKELPTLLELSISAAVPLWIESLKLLPEDELEQLLRDRTPELSEIVACRGDELLFRSNRAGGTAEVFNALAEAVALLAFLPGGVTFAGLSFEARPARG